MKLDKYSVIIISILVSTPIILHINFYETWGNNEMYYLPVNGMEVTCDMNLFQNPSNCNPINEKGEIVKWPENYGHMGN